jgi:CDP-diacylglycerol---glycerol-3-phosphate 3-phosphatidyltransferase
VLNDRSFISHLHHPFGGLSINAISALAHLSLTEIEWYTERVLNDPDINDSISIHRPHQIDPMQKGTVPMLAKYVRPFLADSLSRAAQWLHARGVTPNNITIVGFVLTILAAGMLGFGYLRTGGMVLWLASSFDMLDGALARYSEQTSKFGAFLDSTLDRYSESITLLGLAVYFAGRPDSQIQIFLIFLTLIGSWMVSYTRARAEALEIECKVGILQRPERLTILIAGLILGLLLPALWILAILTNITSLQRIYEVYVRTLPADSGRATID